MYTYAMSQELKLKQIYIFAIYILKFFDSLIIENYLGTYFL